MAQEIDFPSLHKAAYQAMLTSIRPEAAMRLTSAEARDSPLEIRDLEAILMAASTLIMISKTGGYVSEDNRYKMGNMVEVGVWKALKATGGYTRTGTYIEEEIVDMMEACRNATRTYRSAFEDALDKVLLQRVQGISETQLAEHERSALQWLADHQSDSNVVAPSRTHPTKDYRIDIQGLTPTQAEELYLALKDAGVEKLRKLFDWQHPGQPGSSYRVSDEIIYKSHTLIFANKQEVDKALRRGIPGR